MNQLAEKTDFEDETVAEALTDSESNSDSGFEIEVVDDLPEEHKGRPRTSEELNSSEVDDDELKYSVIDEQTYLFEGKISLIDFYRITQVEETPFEAAKGDSSTLGGWIIEILGRVPGKGEVHKIISHTFTIEAGTNRKIDRLKVQLKQA